MSHYIVIEGNLTETPALGYGQESGKPYTRLSIAVNDRIKTDDGYTDGPATFYRVTVFGSRAENAAASFTKGDTVIAAGNLRVEGFTRTDGTTGRSNEITADLVGASVLYGAVTTERATRAVE